MDSVSMNQYEKQLYSVFKTFDVNNEEALDRAAILALCDALQLEERGASLAGALFDGSSGRVTFAQFRNGLLAVLGDSDSTGVVPDSAKASALPLSDDDSSGREVAPKFVFGSKKYGRRSRPRYVADTHEESRSPRASSASRLETDEKKAGRKMRCRRSASVKDTREECAPKAELRTVKVVPCDFDHDRRIGREEAFALCRGLHLDAVDSKLIDSIFSDSTTTETTVGDFFERLNTSLTSSIDEVANVNVITSHDQKSNLGDSGVAVATDVVLEALDAAGVPQSRRLLLELGFSSETVHPLDIERALEDELRALSEPIDERRDARTFLLVAALAVGRLRLDLARQRTDVVVAERDKLRSDLAEANKRAGLLAQEVDESHARIENELKGNLKRMEARHTEALRLAAAEHAAERDKGVQQRARLEAEINRRTELETRLRSEINSLRMRIDEAESRTVTAEERASVLEIEQNKLLTELQAERMRSGEAADSGIGATGELVARVDELRTENKVLRDRNDELCAELETLTKQIQAASDEADRRNFPQEGDLSTELHSFFQQDRSECDSSPVSLDQKVLGHVEVMNRLREILDSIQAMPPPGGGCNCANTITKLKECVSDIGVAMLLSPPAEAVSFKDGEVQTDDSIPASASDVEQLKKQLLEAQCKHDSEQQKLTNLVKDLESSLEQMKFEYDKCEEYWSQKLEEERAMYNEEQRLGDERLADLVARIADYERQFAATASTHLPTIDERHSLEAQVNDLEDEFTKYKKEKEAELAEKEKEIARLKGTIEARERRPAPAGAAGGCACAALAERCRRLEAGASASVAAGRAAGAAEMREMRARTARAEAAVRRLQARLAAADLLVKDLYVENCHLAHRRHI